MPLKSSEIILLSSVAALALVFVATTKITRDEDLPPIPPPSTVTIEEVD